MVVGDPDIDKVPGYSRATDPDMPPSSSSSLVDIMVTGGSIGHLDHLVPRTQASICVAFGGNTGNMHYHGF